MRSSTPITRPLSASLVLLTLVFGACGEGGGVLVVDDFGTLTVTVDATTGTTTPTYRWTGEAARTLSVSRADGTGVVWLLEALNRDVGFPPPVRQGLVPEGASEQIVGDLLESDVSYRVRVVDVEGAFGSVVYRP